MDVNAQLVSEDSQYRAERGRNGNEHKQEPEKRRFGDANG
jgi:hypothetical protein